MLQLNNIRRRELHDYERPIAILAYQQAELNRDRKKKKIPYALEDFYSYMDSNARKLPGTRYGSAFKQLIKMNLCPNWALFIYKDLTNVPDGVNVPDEIALLSDNCIILAPDYNEGECRGMMIALEEASNQIVEFKSTSGQYVTLRVPEIKSKVIADEQACLRVYR